MMPIKNQHTMCRIGSWILLLGFLVFVGPVPLKAASVPIDDTSDILDIGKYVTYIEDIQGAYTISDVAQNPMPWIHCLHKAINMGFTDSVYWFKFSLKNRTAIPQKLYFEITYPLIDHIELYLPTPSGRFQVRRSGDAYPFDQREVIDRNFVFVMNPPIGTTTYYMRIKTSSSLNFIPVLWKPKAFLRRAHTELPIFWLYYGAIFVMAIYNLFIYLSILERSHLYYVLVVISWAFCQMTLNGFAFQYLWPNSIWWANHCLPILMMMSLVGVCLFFRSYLDIKNNFQWINNFLIYLIMIPSLLWAIFSFFGSYALSIKVATVIALYATLTICALAFIPFRRGFRPARIFIVGFIFFALGVLLYTLKTFGILPSNIITRWSIQIGSALVVILVSLGLADKINVMKKKLTMLNSDLVATNENLAIFKRFAEASRQGLNMTDLKGIFTYVNPSFCRMLGTKGAEEIIGEPASRFYPEEMRRLLNNEIYPTVINVGKWMGELQLLSGKGHFVPVIQSFFQIHDNDWHPIYFASVITDITEAKKAESEIHHLNEELELRVMERTKEYENANKALEASLTTLKDAQEQLVQSEKMAALGGLVAGVAHEINTPLGAGITAASLLEDKTKEFRDAYQAGALKRSDLAKYLQTALEASNIIHSNLNRAADLVKSFKQVAVDQSSEVKRTFKINEYIHQVLFSLKPKYKRTRHVIEVNCPEEIAINSYPGVYSQILTNLIMNSLVHGFEHIESGRITINAERNDSELKMSYMDNGVGMDADTLRKIYDPFFTTKRSHGGTGLGMHVSYNLVTQSLGGRMICTSQPGEGVHFTIYIPLEPPSSD